jgi:hypothetical protein
MDCTPRQTRSTGHLKLCWKDQPVLQRNVTERQVWKCNRLIGLDLDVDVGGGDGDHDPSVNRTGNSSL